MSNLIASQLAELCSALGWQGGTYHQALAAVQRHKAALDRIAERTGSDDPCRALVHIARVALSDGPAPPAARRWPFVESPGYFAGRLAAAHAEFHGDMLAAVRNVLIEQPPTLAEPAPAPALPEGMRSLPCAVQIDPLHPQHGWLFIPHVDGQWVTAFKLAPFSQKVIEYWLAASQKEPEHGRR
jgi:hypothetical protein